MITIPRRGFGFINTVRQTVDGLLPGGYLAEAKYLIDRIVAAPSVPRVADARDIVSAGSVKALRGLRTDPLLRDMGYLDQPMILAKEKMRLGQLYRSAQTIRTQRRSRTLKDIPDSVVNGVAAIAQDLADAKDYRTAVSVGMLGGVLNGYRSGDSDDFFKNFAHQTKGLPADIITLAQDLYDNDLFDGCAALLTGATRLQGLQDPNFHNLWSALRTKNLSSATSHDPGRGDILTPSGGRLTDFLAHSVDVPIDFDPTRESAVAEDDRHINAWIDGTDGPLILDRSYAFNINIGKPRTQSLASTAFPDFDWGGRDQLDLLVVLTGGDFRVKPRHRPLTLKKSGDTETIAFTIVPLVAPSALLCISFYLAPELMLLEEFEISIAVEVAQ